MPLTIRPVAPADFEEWAVLYQDYAAFYQVKQTDEMRARVWEWLFDDAQQTEGLVAQATDGALIGIAHFRHLARPLAAQTGGFLDDLFVSPAARGSGAADALISALKDEGKKRGWTLLRWITADDNYRARAVYDRIADRTHWVTYDLTV